MANEAAQKVIDTEPKKTPPLHAMRKSLAEHKRNIWHLEVDIGVEPQDMLTVAYWTHVANELRQFDRIEAHAEDGAWYAEFLVRDVGQNWAKVSLLREIKLESISPERRILILPGHTVAYGGTFSKWRVVRDVDNKVIRDKFATEGDAYAWLTDYAKTVAP